MKNEWIDRILQAEGNAILNTAEKIDAEQIDAVIKGIANCKGKIILSGCGTSAAAAKKISHTLNCVGCPSLFMEPSDAVHGGLGVVEEEDVVILVSKGGETKEINELLPAIKEKNTIIAVTENPVSMIAKKSSILLQMPVVEEPDPFHMLATSSIMAVIAVFDAICINIMEQKAYSKKEFARIHPGGAVGKKLQG